MNELAISVTDLVEPEASALISAGLDEFNIEATGIADRRPLAVLVRDPETDRVVGGLTGRTSLGCCSSISSIYRPSSAGRAIGGEVLKQAEEEARRRGCRTGMLYTIQLRRPASTSGTVGRSRVRWRATRPVPGRSS